MQTSTSSPLSEGIALKKLLIGITFCFVFMPAIAQAAPQQGAVNSESVQSILADIQELRTALTDVRQQLASSRIESQALRQELNSLRQQLAAPGNGVDETAALAENQRLLEDKINDQYQTKVESGSKYRVRLSGQVLVNVFNNRGNVNNLDLPTFALPEQEGTPDGSFGISARQSTINIDVVGPSWNGAKFTGNLSMDFFGGFPLASNGLSSALQRLRLATVSMNWTKTSITMGQDALFFSPLSPSSVASTAYPSLSSSGNLWTWTPQVRIEHRIPMSENSHVFIQGGILDAFTGELSSEYDRLATAGELSRMPGYATRWGWSRTVDDRLTMIGGGAYYSRQDWNFGRTVDAWAGTADWNVPLPGKLSLSGELYRGRAIGGLGGGITSSVIFTGSPQNPDSSVIPVDSAGGWAQLKFKPLTKVEFNTAWGEDYPFRTQHRSFPPPFSGDNSTAGRNSSGFANIIYQPKSNLTFSIEYRRLWTTGFSESRQTGSHLAISSAIGF